MKISINSIKNITLTIFKWLLDKWPLALLSIIAIICVIVRLMIIFVVIMYEFTLPLSSGLYLEFLFGAKSKIDEGFLLDRHKSCLYEIVNSQSNGKINELIYINSYDGKTEFINCTRKTLSDIEHSLGRYSAMVTEDEDVHIIDSYDMINKERSDELSNYSKMGITKKIYVSVCKEVQGVISTKLPEAAYKFNCFDQQLTTPGPGHFAMAFRPDAKREVRIIIRNTKDRQNTHLPK